MSNSAFILYVYIYVCQKKEHLVHSQLLVQNIFDLPQHSCNLTNQPKCNVGFRLVILFLFSCPNGEGDTDFSRKLIHLDEVRYMHISVVFVVQLFITDE